jgi:hypothetical protein
VTHLVDAADESVLYGVGADLLREATASKLTDTTARGVTVTVVSADDAVTDRFAGADGIHTREFPDRTETDRQQAGRVLVVDGETILLSITGDSPASSGAAETAIWSAGTGFAAVLVRLMNTWMEKHVGL